MEEIVGLQEDVRRGVGVFEEDRVATLVILADGESVIEPVPIGVPDTVFVGVTVVVRVPVENAVPVREELRDALGGGVEDQEGLTDEEDV